jgi:integrase
MPKMHLTEMGVRALKPTPGKQIDYFDDPAKGGVPGLFLRVSYGGTKAWRVVWYQRGKPRTHQLKRFPIFSLANARAAAKSFLQDPEAALREEAQEDFKTIWESFLKRHVEAQGLRSRNQIERTMKLHVLPVWGKMRFTDIRRGDVSRLLDKIEERSGSRQADAVLATIRKICIWYQARNENYISPVVPGMQRSSPAEHRRKRFLADVELRALWTASAGIETYGALIRVAVLTAQRRDKLSTMKWTDISDGVWTIATEPREKGNPGQIALTAMALDIIHAQPKIFESPFVFPSSQGRGPFNSFSQRFEELYAGMKKLQPDMQPFVLHDLRRTARSLMSRAGVRPDVAERCLGHTVGNAVEQTYDRHNYFAEMTQAFETLSNLIGQILNPATVENVVVLLGRRH